MDSEVQEQIPVQEELFLCSGVEAQVIKCGPWTNLFDEQGVNRPKVLILIIPGNPGFSPVYVPFMKALYCMMNNRVPVWVVSHAGFYSAPKDQKTLTAPEESNAQDIKDICGLNGQIEHKIAFLRAHVPKDMKIILIAHSIGCYISLHVMKRVPEIPIIHAFLLFPTIERMAESPHGRIATPLLCWFRYMLYATSYLLLKPCPEIIKSFLTEQVMGKMGFQDKIPMKNCIQPYCFANAAYLGSQEMIQVVERDNEIIKEHLHKLTFYYGQKDNWCPVRFYEDMKKDFPEGNIQLCKKGIPHAFVLRCSQEMATIVANWINNILPKI
ncbi:lipid droplet-associated hydrolase [Acomys russatus]|uniref:lipid droplet-associated hydrolase n=1 Tax=Acomys russatus TaxID=60746 RepID=UPI0021E1F6D3|nr:lipid droplet-associated hydrolase [Acomys russatus]XP_050999300.1 lipid droplet-associated hydrolase [Acomys russatus]XP_050999304.1 lipid droplet-associated hydrolase [Acomys russatus]XP_050999306.1 lipid droplet-associated hydrolase [Acomys russatus]